MPQATERSICWSPTWSPGFETVGLEHLLLSDGGADSVLLAIDKSGTPIRLHYSIRWDDTYRVREADLQVRTDAGTKHMHLRSDGAGQWTDAEGHALSALEGCIDIDIWPTPMTNSLPLWRAQLQVGERREFRMAWISAPDLTLELKPQAYTRLSERRYLFESLDKTQFKVELEVDEHQIVLDYPELFRRVLKAG
ncbi:putative glycolipid-binding domain-containing protein [Roseateles sp.]|uniref:putative glycolipid-binding domain-containing protein n=1 Tax=Roseateles sp. TaxID=1971397 RepID=UPI003265E559